MRVHLVLVVVLLAALGCEGTIEHGATTGDAGGLQPDGDGLHDGALSDGGSLSGDGAWPEDGGGGPGDGGGASDGAPPDGGPPDPVAMNRALGRGINMGNFLEAPNEGDWTAGRRIQQGDFSLIKGAGFDSVRVPVKWSAHALTTPPYTIDQAFMARVQEVVDWALAASLNVVLNIHHYDEIHSDPSGHRARFVALWQQIATAFKEKPLNRVVYELLNEPTMSGADWNSLLRDGISTIRAIDPDRTIMVGPVGWNSAWALNELDLPADEKNLIVTVHMYEPFWFTHSGAPWVSPTPPAGAVWNGTPEEKKPIDDALNLAATWASQHGRPMFVGEFGAYSAAEYASRVRWTTYVVDSMASRGFSWAYWEFCAGFGVYDPDAGAFRQDLLQALIH